MVIRKIELSDAEDVAFISTTALGYPSTAEIVSKNMGLINPEAEHVLVAEDGGKVVGFIHAQVYTSLYEDFVVNVKALAVDTSVQNHGAGRLLMEGVEKWAKEKGIYVIRLSSGFNRTGAHGFYRHIGFELYKEHKTFKKFLKES